MTFARNQRSQISLVLCYEIRQGDTGQLMVLPSSGGVGFFSAGTQTHLLGCHANYYGHNYDQHQGQRQIHT